jgi:hypothetical protein
MNPQGRVGMPTSTTSNSKKMLPHRRITWAAVGAISPLVLELLAVNHVVALSQFDVYEFLGQLFYGSVTVAAATIVVLLFEDEHNRLRLFYLGLSAPVILSAIVNPVALQINEDASASAPVAFQAPARASSPVLPLSVAFAQSEPPSFEFEACSRAKEEGHRLEYFPASNPYATPAQRFLKGFIGVNPPPARYVITGTYQTFQEAQAVASIRGGSIYCTPSALDAFDPFTVVLLATPSLLEAQAERDRAVAAGFEDAVVWPR